MLGVIITFAFIHYSCLLFCTPIYNSASDLSLTSYNLLANCMPINSAFIQKGSLDWGWVGFRVLLLCKNNDESINTILDYVSAATHGKKNMIPPKVDHHGG